ncbi:hypothetical protein T07_6060 [Trichinella nelsoni]|uniref:Uncharacterized protein n=1 Tax=Trichinella nelsoni TaxID=6336 RepID=A0A0V0RUU2_9BILA|nr:hypothetical protein T07_6060 [Trichinella nelsoni]
MTSNLHVVAALPADLQFRLGLSDLCCFCKNMTEFSPNLRLLPCENSKFCRVSIVVMADDKRKAAKNAPVVHLRTTYCEQ